jgi:hypothetical protein
LFPVTRGSRGSDITLKQGWWGRGGHREHRLDPVYYNSRWCRCCHCCLLPYVAFHMDRYEILMRVRVTTIRYVTKFIITGVLNPGYDITYIVCSITKRRMKCLRVVLRPVREARVHDDGAVISSHSHHPPPLSQSQHAVAQGPAVQNVLASGFPLGVSPATTPTQGQRQRVDA